VLSEQEQRAATASQFVAALGGAIRHADLDKLDRRRRADRTLLWRAAIQLTSSPNRRALHD
jgi:hypothetical protein